MKKILVLLALVSGLFANMGNVSIGVSNVNVEDSPLNSLGLSLQYKHGASYEGMPQSLRLGATLDIASDDYSYLGHTINVDMKLVQLEAMLDLGINNLTVSPLVSIGRVFTTTSTTSISISDDDQTLGIGCYITNDRVSVFYKIIDLNNPTNDRISQLGMLYKF
jgi:hypothetical protein